LTFRYIALLLLLVDYIDMYLIFIFDIKTFFYISNVQKLLYRFPIQVGIASIFPTVILRWMFLLNLNKRKEYFFHLKIKNKEGNVVSVPKMKFYVKMITFSTKWYSILIIFSIPMSIFFIISTIWLFISFSFKGNSILYHII
jgi:hypothetical protein